MIKIYRQSVRHSAPDDRGARLTVIGEAETLEFEGSPGDAADYLEKRIPIGASVAAIEPEFIGFVSAQAAIDHRREGAGGWIFIPDNAAGAVWFSLNFTAGAVMRHHAAKGSGRLI